MAVVLAGNSDFGNGEGAYVVNKPIMLEPIMSVEASTPTDYQGDIMGDLNRRRGHSRGFPEYSGDCQPDGYQEREMDGNAEVQ